MSRCTLFVHRQDTIPPQQDTVSFGVVSYGNRKGPPSPAGLLYTFRARLSRP